MRVLAAFDKFKDSMSASTACEAASRGIREALGTAVQITQAPLTDGGEGFCGILTNAANGVLETHRVCGPLGIEVSAALGWVNASQVPLAVRDCFDPSTGRIAIIEMAAAAGLEKVPIKQRHPQHCTTYGVGELIRIAIEGAADAILLGIGGSATSDLGLGLLQALGLAYIDSNHHTIERIVPADWARVQHITGSIAVTLPALFIACDVDNPLLGANGAAAVYGPQKGLRAEELGSFESASARMASMLCHYFKQSEMLCNRPGSGAAGGIGFGLQVACNAHYVAGFELVAAWLDLEHKIAAADLILSGEGKIDLSSLNGKGPVAVAGRAHASDKPSILCAGCVEPSIAERVQRDFPQCTVYSITPEGCPQSQALAEGPYNLGATIAKVLRKQTPL